MRPLVQSCLRCLTFCTAFVFCWPVFLMMQIRHNHRQELFHGTRRPRGRSPYRTHEGRRRRALTPSQTAPVKQQTHTQHQCALLYRLPTEVRQMIWGHLLGDMALHLTLWDRRLSHIHCLSKQPELCISLELPTYCSRRMYQEAGPMGCHHLALLQTCRSIYIEAAPILYSRNSFTVLDTDCLEYLPRLMLPQRIALIKILRFKWSIKGTLESLSTNRRGKHGLQKLIWHRIWANIAAMRNLDDLHVVLLLHGAAWGNASASLTSALEPLTYVTTTSRFQLTVPYSVNVEGSAWKNLPCHINKLPNPTPA